VTSSVVNRASNDGASEMRSSRNVTCRPHNTGRPVRQSEATTCTGGPSAVAAATSGCSR
jgi:hypothetical protein